MLINPIQNNPVLLIEWKERILVLADTHIGIEEEIREQGMNIRSQTSIMLDEIVKLCEKHSAKRLVHLGDVKHNVPKSKKQEWLEIPLFFQKLLNVVPNINIVPGNHDGNLKKLSPKDVKIQRTDGFRINGLDVGFLHGHTWPAKEITEARYLVMGHNHPTIMFKDSMGARETEPCWLRARLSAINAKEIYGNANPEIIIMPSFNRVCGGNAFNVPNAKLLGPLFKNRLIDIENADVYLLDGTNLGRLGDLTCINAA